jgi:hypothetical protein
MSWNEGGNRPLEELSREAAFYTSFFGNKRERQWTGLLLQVLKETPEEVKRQAAISAVYYSYFPLPGGQTLYRPDSWFTSACRGYARHAAVMPAEVRAWAATDLPLGEICRRIREGSRLPHEQGFGGLNERG